MNEEYEGGFDIFDGASEVLIIDVWTLDRNNGCTLKIAFFRENKFSFAN